LSDSDRRLHVGDRLSDFSLIDLAGRNWRLDDLLGRPSVLFLFSSW